MSRGKLSMSQAQVIVQWLTCYTKNIHSHLYYMLLSICFLSAAVIVQWLTCYIKNFHSHLYYTFPFCSRWMKERYIARGLERGRLGPGPKQKRFQQGTQHLTQLLWHPTTTTLVKISKYHITSAQSFSYRQHWCLPMRVKCWWQKFCCLHWMAESPWKSVLEELPRIFPCNGVRRGTNVMEAFRAATELAIYYTDIRWRCQDT